MESVYLPFKYDPYNMDLKNLMDNEDEEILKNFEIRVKN